MLPGRGTPASASASRAVDLVAGARPIFDSGPGGGCGTTLSTCLDCGALIRRGPRCYLCGRAHDRHRRANPTARYGPGYRARHRAAIDAEPWCHADPCRYPDTAGSRANPLTADHPIPIAAGGSPLQPLVPMCRSAIRRSRALYPRGAPPSRAPLRRDAYPLPRVIHTYNTGSDPIAAAPHSYEGAPPRRRYAITRKSCHSRRTRQGVRAPYGEWWRGCPPPVVAEP